ncbi:21182_t:CDS:2 [Rhizophagus irregularis]|nr:21182_t:CDS:2 [Rhizophagus irregularis]
MTIIDLFGDRVVSHCNFKHSARCLGLDLVMVHDATADIDI